MVQFTLILVLSLFFVKSYAARILCFYPVPFLSHQSVFRVLTKELSSRGHELVVITSEQQMNENITEINIKNISEVLWHEDFAPNVKVFYERDKYIDTVTVLYLSLETLYKNTIAIISSSKVQELIRNRHEKFDLLLVEECVPVNLIIAVGFDAPVIFVSSYYSNHIGLQVTGSEKNPIYHADNNFGEMLWNSWIWEKLTALIFSTRFNFMFWHFEQTSNDLIKQHFGDNNPTVRELKNKVQMMFLNTYQFWDFSRPVAPSVLYTGGMHLQEPKELPADIKSYLDSATKGVLYMSLGSKFQSSDLPEDTLTIIMNVFASLPYNVIWKLDGKLPGEHNNIRIEPWLPQNDLLHHPSIKAFITHAGLQSTDEAIAAGVPLVALPIVYDQFSNANNYVLHGIGIKLNIKTINEKEFREAIIEVVENERYRNNIKRLEGIMKQHRVSSLNKTMHYIDYVLKHGKTNLHSPAANLFEEYYQFDVIIPVIALLFVIFIVLILFLTKLFCLTKQLFEFK